MKAIQRILLATDFSETAHNALLYALDLAREARAEVIILHAYQVPTPDFNPYGINYPQVVYPEKHHRTAEKKMAQLRHDFLYAPKVAYECLVRTGPPPDVIHNVAIEKAVDLIVMGTRRAEGARAWFGSVTTHTVRHSKLPVLVIPQEVRFKRPRKIVLATYHIEVQHIELLEVLRAFADLFDCGLEVLHLHASGKQGQAAHRRIYESLQIFLGHTLHFAYSDQEPVNDAIQQYLDNSGADMLAMLPLKHGLLEQLVHNSKTKYMIFHTRVPLLALR